MPRWQPGARERFEAAALELFVTRGYEQTTVAEIAARAGLTERTFYRHFTDKQEVLFSGGAGLMNGLTAEIAAAPAAMPALQVVTRALMDMADAFFAGREPAVRQRQIVIDANPALRERELQKLAALAAAVEQTLRERGIDARTASLAAETGISVFRIAFAAWLEPGNTLPLRDLISQTMSDLRRIASENDDLQQSVGRNEAKGTQAART
jgi:AcrR family transcriptional regulator